MQCNALKHLRFIYGLYKKYIIITPVIFCIIHLITNHKKHVYDFNSALHFRMKNRAQIERDTEITEDEPEVGKM